MQEPGNSTQWTPEPTLITEPAPATWPPSPTEASAEAVVPPPPSATAFAPSETRHRLEFTGTAGEYFRIWIVNVALSIATLGIYSAWATVRKRRYFYASTKLAGSPFEYLANPVAILKGRLIAAVALGILVGASYISQILYFCLAIGLVFAVPWAIVRTLKFRARYSSWRGLNLRFDGTRMGAAKVFLLWPMLAPFTLGLLYPWIVAKQQEYAMSNLHYGQSRFSFTFQPGRYYRPILLAGLGFLICYIAIIVGVAIFAIAGDEFHPERSFVFWAAMGGTYLYATVATTYVRARITNLLWNHTSIEPHRFESALKARAMIWLVLTNALAVIASVGLLIPWAAVRTMRYRASCFTFVAEGDLDQFVAGATVPESAVGSEFGELMDFEMEFGF